MPDWLNMTIALSHARPVLQRLAVIVAVIIQIGSTALPALGFGEPIGSRSDSIRTLITPAGTAFTIWGFLYLGAALFAIWQALPAQRHNALLERIAWPAAGAFFGNGIWALYTQFGNLTAISALIILFNLFCIMLVLRAFIQLDRPFTLSEKLLAVLPQSSLAAWLTAASIVNIAAALKYHGLVVPQETGAAITAGVLIVGGIVAAAVVMRSKGNLWYALTFLWALLWIALKGGQQFNIITIACAGAAAMVVLTTAAALRHPLNRRHWFG